VLTDKVCVVTGAASGIGRATAVEMARRGARVVLADVDVAGAGEVAGEIEAAGGEALAVACDVTELDQVQAAMEQAASRFGGIDVLHNNAGISESNVYGASTLETLPDPIFQRVFDVNVRGTWWATRAALPFLKRSERGPAIVNASSVGGQLAVPNSAAYCASKAAVINLTRSMALDFAPYGIRCNCYCPGSIRTPMLDAYVESAGGDAVALSHLTASQLMDRPGEAIEVAKLVCFLVSDESSFMTGSIVTIDGGKLAWRGTRSA
jgi:NAD(P)-dependent dehydrogenase (short-subunit alcohol dehydrogenase family)